MKIISPPGGKTKYSTTVLPERILLFGGPNTGKSRALLSTLFYHPENTFHVIDPDDGILRVMNELGGEEAFPNLILYPAQDYSDIRAAVDTILNTAQPGDWVGAEMLNRWWDATQSEYSSFVYGETVAEHLTAIQQQLKNSDDEKKRGQAANFEGFTDWKLIKRMHNQDLMDRLCVYRGLNIIATTTVKDFVEYTDKSMAEASIFSRAKVRPEGEKHNPHLFSTIIYLYRSVNGDYLADSLREKGIGTDGHQRQLFVAMKYTGLDFWDAYSRRSGIVVPG